MLHCFIDIWYNWDNTTGCLLRVATNVTYTAIFLQSHYFSLRPRSSFQFNFTTTTSLPRPSFLAFGYVAWLCLRGHPSFRRLFPRLLVFRLIARLVLNRGIDQPQKDDGAEHGAGDDGVDDRSGEERTVAVVRRRVRCLNDAELLWRHRRQRVHFEGVQIRRNDVIWCSYVSVRYVYVMCSYVVYLTFSFCSLLSLRNFYLFALI